MTDGAEAAALSSPSVAAPSADPKSQRGVAGMIWSAMGLVGSLFSRGNKNDFEKRLQHLSKEEVSVHSRLKLHTQRWRKLARVMIIYSVVGEALALGFAILSTRSADLPWQVRAIRALPVFALPAVVTLLYSTCAGYHRMMERKDQERLERLKAKRQEKINELKEKTNYYITQQLIQQYDPDPAAKAAAASILASKLGAESGLKLAYAAGLTNKDDLAAQGMSAGTPKDQTAPGGSLDGDPIDAVGLRNRRPQQRRESVGPASSQGMQRMEGFAQENNVPGAMGTSEVWDEQGMDVKPPRNRASDGGWVARLAAMLVGEDPTQCCALICKKCHAHNGLAKKEDYQYIQYYCPHCRTLNGTAPAGGGLQLNDDVGEMSPNQEQAKAMSPVEASQSNNPEISNSAAPALVSQLISDLSGITKSLKRMEDVIGISLIHVKRELMFTTSKLSSRPSNGIFKEKLIKFYGVDTTGPVDLNKDWTRYIRCMMTNKLFTQKDVTAAHLIVYSMRHYAPMLLGMKDLDSPRNGLLLLKPLEDAFDDARICFSYDKLMDSFILHILDAEYLDKKVGDSKKLSKPSKATLGDTTFKDLEGRVILFPNNKRPFKRALQFHARQAIALSIERDTLPEMFCMESWDFDYGSAGDYKDVVERWFTRNTEYIDGSKDISASEDVRQDDCVRVKKTKFVDEDLAVVTNSEGWSEDRTITPEANSESWSEEPRTVTPELT